MVLMSALALLNPALNFRLPLTSPPRMSPSRPITSDRSASSSRRCRRRQIRCSRCPFIAAEIVVRGGAADRSTDPPAGKQHYRAAAGGR